ncbi:HAD domain-containing protein [Flavobacterium sp.]|uniref:HAD domain-containing protein n=1 Tax=Flavobacterium sp. TaxID=239 RepID=UPI001210EC00|nr:HAD domain-containing protein [Flavobacterium sp.]RZJ71275.1 MAG: hypothetical protein EOO49_11030 [Flavobacterium sp.]
MLLLLDIDGVMVPTTTWKPSEILSDGFANFNSRAKNSLQTIIDRTGTSILLTTSHKSRFDISEWMEIFRNRGIIADIDILRSNNDYLTRKDEIIRWFTEANTSESFVILDDDKSLNGLPNHLKSKAIITSGTVGLTPDQAEEAIQILTNQELITI